MARTARQTFRRPLLVSRLEDRVVPTSNLFIDFGDNFPVGGLGLTALQLRDTFAGGGLQGPDVRRADNAMTIIDETIDDGTNLTFNPTAPLVTIDYNGDGSTNAADYTSLRAAVLAIVQRYYSSFDVNVQIAPAVNNASSATYIAGVQTQLQAGANTDGERDSWVFVANVLRTADGASVGALTSNFGISAGVDIGGNNARDDSEIAYADRILNSSNAVTADTRLAYTTAHEAGHDFGLQHTNNGSDNNGNSASGNAQTDADMRLLTSSNVVTDSAPATNRNNFDFFTRFDLTRGDNNVGGMFNINDKVNHFEQLANNNNLGLGAGQPTYFTGTGAFDRVTVTGAGAGLVNVTVQAFREAAFTNLIGTYTQNNVSIANGLLIELGLNADTLILDATIGNIVTVRGMANDDTLIVQGNGIANGAYAPGTNKTNSLDDNIDLRGTFAIGLTTILLQEFEVTGRVSVQDVGTFSFTSPGGTDVLNISSPAAGQNRITGTVSDGVPIIPFDFFNVTTFTVDAGNNDGMTGDDSISIDNPGLVATDLQTFTVTTGIGNDTLSLFTGNFLLPVNGGGFNYQGGTGTDKITAQADVNFTLSDTKLTSSGGGSINLNSIEQADLTGGPSDNSFLLTNWTGLANLDGGVGSDTYTINFNGVGGIVNVNDIGAVGTDCVNVNGTAATDTFTVTGAKVSTAVEIVNYLGVEKVVVDAMGSGDAINVQSTSVPTTVNGSAGDDIIRVSSNAGVDDNGNLNGILAALMIDAGTGTNRLIVSDLSGAANPNVVITSTKITGLAPADITYGATGGSFLNGASSNGLLIRGSNLPDNIKVQSTLAGSSTTVQGNNGDDTFTIQGDGLAGINVFDAGADSDFFTLNAGIGVSGTSVAIVGGEPGFDNFNVNGRSGDDPVTLKFAQGTVASGGGGRVEGLGQVVQFDTLESIVFDGLTGRNDFCFIDNTNIMMGSALNPFGGILYRPSTATSGDLRFNGNILTGQSNTPDVTPLVVFSNVNGVFKVNGDGNNSGDCDTLTVLGYSTAAAPGLQSNFLEYLTNNGSDTITATDKNVAITNATIGQLRSVTLDDTGGVTVCNLVIRAGNEPPIFGDNVTIMPSARINIFADGMDPACGGPGDTLKVLTTGTRTIFRQLGDDPNKGPDGHARIREDATGAEVGFIHFETVIGAGAIAIGTDVGAKSTVRWLDATTQTPRLPDIVEVFPGFFGGVRVAAGDLTGDGIADFVAAAGPGGGSHVIAFDGITGAEIANFFAYDAAFRGGVNVAIGDLDCDGKAEIITAPASAGGPHVKVFTNGVGLTREFFAYAADFNGGVNLAVGDINKDGPAEIITAPGEGGGPHVKVFDNAMNVIQEFMAYRPEFLGGVSVAVGDVDGDNMPEIITGAGNGGGPHLRVFTNGVVIREFFVNDPFFPNLQPQIPRETGLRVSVADVDGDGVLDVLATKGKSTRPFLRATRIANFGEAVRPLVFDPLVYGFGVFVGGSR